MKTIFIGARVRRQPKYEEVVEKINSLPEGKIAICYSNQFIEVAKKISESIEKEVTAKIQVLGCSRPRFPEGTEGIVIIGQGKFHPVSLAYESQLPTYVLEDSNLRQITKEEIEKMEKKEKGALLKYLMSDKIGILITNKPGQMRVKKAIEFKESLKNKRGYLFIDNNMDIAQFENFGMDFWVNTACPRMDLTDGPLINLEKIPSDALEKS